MCRIVRFIFYQVLGIVEVKEMENGKMEKEKMEVTKEQIKEYVSLWKYYDKSYFWSPAHLAALRRKAEEKNTHHKEFSFDGHDYVMDITMQQSAKHVYVSRELTRDGKTVTIRALTKYGVE